MSVKSQMAETRACLLSDGKEIDIECGSMSKPMIHKAGPRLALISHVVAKFHPRAEAVAPV